MATPSKNSQRSKLSENPRVSENSDPNLSNSTPSRRPVKSPLINSAKSKMSTPKTPTPIRPPPPPPIRGKKFKISKEKEKNSKNCNVDESREGIKKDEKNSPSEKTILSRESGVVGDSEGNSSKVKKMRSLVLEEAMSSIPEPGAGRVMYLVKTFEKLLSISKDQEGSERIVEGNKEKRVMSWALPGLQQPPKAEETEVSSSSLFSTPEFEMGCSEHSSTGSNGDRLSRGSSTSDGEPRSQHNSTGSTGKSWNKKLKATSQQPFKLRTEQRGRIKEEHFLMKMKELLLEEEKQRVPIAQGLPWTTDNPECLVKPFVKETTDPIDLVLHTDVRAVERAEFDQYIAERMSVIEQMKLERERLQKLQEEEEIRRLRKQLVPRAQPMPFFDRPFIPSRLQKPRTVTKEPRLQNCEQKTWKTRKREEAETN